MRNVTLLLIVVTLVMAGCDPQNKVRNQGPMAPGPTPLEPPSDRADVYDPYGYEDGSSTGYDRYDENRPFPPADDPYESTTVISDPPYTPSYTPPPYTPPAYTPPAYTPPAPAPTPAPVPPPAPRALTHTIRKGDTLWAISTRYLGSGRRWKEIVALNPGLDPSKLPIGKEITIPSR